MRLMNVYEISSKIKMPLLHKVIQKIEQQHACSCEIDWERAEKDKDYKCVTEAIKSLTRGRFVVLNTALQHIASVAESTRNTTDIIEACRLDNVPLIKGFDGMNMMNKAAWAFCVLSLLRWDDLWLNVGVSAISKRDWFVVKVASENGYTLPDANSLCQI